ncbi:MAG: toprim domain-containing protein [Rhizobiaceae bacterium]|nr:toprim domain-containing protein [Rhizobiaceae bacterium]
MTHSASQHESYDPGALARDLARDTEGFCRRYFPDGRKVGNYWQMGDVTGAKGRSLTVRLSAAGGRQAGKWTDHATGEHGDLLDLLGHRLEPIAYRDLLKEASDYLGHRPTVSLASLRASESDPPSRPATERGRRLFRIGRPIAGTPAERYLRARRIDRFGPALAFHPQVYLKEPGGNRIELPALLAAITDNAGRIAGCSRIFLDRDSDGLARIEAPKRVLGQLAGNAIRFGPWASARDLIAGEGLENALSVGTALPAAALVSCLTANHLAAFMIPPNVERLWIARDKDDAGARGANALADRARGRGVQPFVLTPVRCDFNADLCFDGVTGLRRRLRRLIEAEVTWHDLWPLREGAGKE